MKVLRNFATHPWQAVLQSADGEAFTIPAGEAVQGGVRPGLCTVTDEQLAELRAGRVSKGWFGPHGLMTEEEIAAAQEAAAKAKAEAAAKDAEADAGGKGPPEGEKPAS